MNEEKTGCPYRVVTGFLDDNQGEIRLVKDRKLSGKVEHTGIGADQPVPLVQVVQREKQFPVVHAAEPRINPADGNQICLGHAKPESLNDGIREVLVQCEAGHVSGGPLETSILFELLFEIDTVLQRVGTSKRIDSCKLFHRKPPVPQSID